MLGESEFQSVFILISFLLRLVLHFNYTNLTFLLDDLVEFSSPLNSFKSLMEAFFNLNNDYNNLYDGGIVHQQPLLVYFLSFFNRSSDTLLLSIIYSLSDIIIGLQLAEINKILYGKKNYLPCLLYLINPICLLSNLSKSTMIFSNLFLVLSVKFVLLNLNSSSKDSRRLNVMSSGVSLAISSYLSFYPVYLIFPFCSIIYNINKYNNAVNKNSSNSFGNVVNFIVFTLFSIVILLILSYVINDFNWNFIQNTYIVVLNFEKLIPNLGLWWYFFIEMFEMFLPFFHAIFNLFVFSLILPFTIRFSSYDKPIANKDNINNVLMSFWALILCIGWITLTKAYPTVGDFGFFVSFIPFFTPVFGYMTYPILSVLLFLHAIILSPIFYHLWIDLGSGNSNFFYAISLVYALSIASIIVDLIWSVLRFEYDDGKPNYNIKLVQF